MTLNLYIYIKCYLCIAYIYSFVFFKSSLGQLLYPIQCKHSIIQDTWTQLQFVKSMVAEPVDIEGHLYALSLPQFLLRRHSEQQFLLLLGFYSGLKQLKKVMTFILVYCFYFLQLTLLFLLFGEKVLLNNPGLLGIHDAPVSTYHVLGLQAYATMSDSLVHSLISVDVFIVRRINNLQALQSYPEETLYTLYIYYRYSVAY